MSVVPKIIRNNLGKVLLSLGMSIGGAGVYTVIETDSATEHTEMVASDTSTSVAVKIAMVVGSYYESSGKHIGTPYIDYNGKGQPLTVCNGVTGDEVIEGKYYTEKDCYELEKRKYIEAEDHAKSLLKHWEEYDPFIQASFIDFIYNKGVGNFKSSTMLRLANSGDVLSACRQNPRWVRGTVNGVSVVLPGLVNRANTNQELCLSWRVASSPEDVSNEDGDEEEKQIEAKTVDNPHRNR